MHMCVRVCAYEGNRRSLLTIFELFLHEGFHVQATHATTRSHIIHTIWAFTSRVRASSAQHNFECPSLILRRYRG